MLMPRYRLWNSLGPGILLAATSIGASHLVFSPQAGALFGYQLLWLVVFSHVLKYPAFEFGPRYAAATGHHLLDGYARIPGPRGWALVVFLISTLAQGIGVLAGVVSIAGVVLWTWTGLLDSASCAVLLTGIVVVLLLGGGFTWLDHLNKIMMAILAVATFLAFVPVLPGPEVLPRLVVPSLPPGSIVLVAAILGWMPTGIDVSVWHSFWTLEKIRRNEPDGDLVLDPLEVRAGRLRRALLDMRLGYGLSLCTGVMFVIMGAVHLMGRGHDLQGVEFAEALSTAYTNILGRWMYHVFMLAALLAMFSTSYTVIDGFSRSFAEGWATLCPAAVSTSIRKRLYVGFVCAASLIACAVIVTIGRNPIVLVTAVALISLTAAPLLYSFNLYCVLNHIDQPGWRVSWPTIVLAVSGIAFTVLALGTTAFVELLR
jgi:Mn2+/Fe2+ NRAMP family transporter